MIIAILIMVLFLAGAVKGYRNKNKKQCLTCSAVTALNVMLIGYMNLKNALSDISGRVFFVV